MNHFAARINARVGSVKQNAQQAIDQRNAQSLVSMYQAGQAAGIEWTGVTKEAKIQAVVMGGSPTSGPFTGKTFQVPNLSSSAQAGAAKYIGLMEGDLAYVRPQPSPTEASGADDKEPEFPSMPKLPDP